MIKAFGRMSHERRTATAFLLLLTLIAGCSGGSLPPTASADGRPTTSAPAVPATPSPAATSATRKPSHQPPPTSSTAPSASPEVDGNGNQGGIDLPPPPPQVTVSTPDTRFDLPAWTYCFGNGCVDGGPPSDLPDVGRARRVEIEFPLDGWTFQATFVPVGVACPRRQSVPVAKTGDRTHILEPAGPADTYDVTLFGRGNGDDFGRGGGDLFVTFRWKTPHDGPMPIPDARLAVLADRDGAVDSYGVELELSDLRATPTSARAEITVTAANGRSLTFQARRVDRCVSEGVVYWDGPDRAGSQAAKLGPAPFTYHVTVVLDGVRYTATASWPADVIRGNAPSVDLRFSPPLPALP